ncbi:transposase, partial [bacterium]|nr:transposase [bacterium]
RTRYWRTVRLDERFRGRAEKALWRYANAPRPARRGIRVVCTDETPAPQVLDRDPIRRAIPGPVERREFEYTRHGTANPLLFLVVHTGRMERAVPGAHGAANDARALRQFRRRHRRLKGVFLAHGGGPSHVAAAATDYRTGRGPWRRPRLTPAHASWSNPAELLVNAFGGRYLKRGSWSSRDAFVEHVPTSWPEYNRLYAHPFEWTWANNQVRDWFATHAPPICCTTSQQRH